MGRWVAGVGHRGPLLLHFIRQQTHRESGSDKDRRTASSDSQRQHSAQAEARESRWKEGEALTETDDSVIKPRTKGDIMKFDRDTELHRELIKARNKRCILARGTPLSGLERGRFW